MTVEAEPNSMDDELLGAARGMDLNITGASDLEWRPGDVLLEFDDESATRPETPAASLAPA